MKRTIKVCIIMLMFIMITTLKVYAAASYNMEIKGNETVEQGEEITLTIGLKDLIDIGGSANGISAITANVEFDETKLEKVSQAGLNGFIVTWGNKIVLDSSNGVSTNIEIATITLKAKADAVLGATDITISNILGSNGSEDISAAGNAVKTITIAEATEQPDGTKSSNNNLTSLLINGQTITGFNKDTLIYILPAVENSKSSIEISTVAEDAKSTITGIGTKSLNVGNNTFNIIVKAEDGTEKTYVINVERKAAGNNNSNNSSNNNSNNGSNNITEKLPEKLPQAGENMLKIIGSTFIILIVIGIISFKKSKQY